MSLFFSGFADELVKTAGISGLLERLRESPELRKAIKNSTLLGAATGAVQGAVSKKEEHESRLRKILGGAGIGAVGGGITGAVMPGWFSRQNHYAADEFHRLTTPRKR